MPTLDQRAHETLLLHRTAAFDKAFEGADLGADTASVEDLRALRALLGVEGAGPGAVLSAVVGAVKELQREQERLRLRLERAEGEAREAREALAKIRALANPW